MTDNASNEYFLSNGNKIVILNRLGMEKLYGKTECARNIYLFDKQGNAIWQISSDSDTEGNPFTHVTLHVDGRITAYRWDGGSYLIDDKTGRATPDILMR